MRRVILTLLVFAGLGAALIFWLGNGISSPAVAGAAVVFFLGLLLVGFLFCRLCCRLKRWEAWRFILFWAAFGLLWVLPFQGGRYQTGLLATIFAIIGALAGAAFWGLAIWRNHDLTCPKSICLPCGTVYRMACHALSRQSK